MKYPQLKCFADVLPDLDNFSTIIDVRSQDEFAEDHIPNAINCPVLDNQERILVGTTYKQISSFQAKKIGASLTAKNIAHHLDTQFSQHEKEWRPLVYCWRGGNRSGSLAHVLAKIGWPVVQIDGGYKDYRRYINAELPILAAQIQWRVICGTTGSGKSRLLQALSKQGAQVLDLESLAAHRGSVLGNLPTQAQPTQKMFESHIWQTLRHFDLNQPVYIESESKKVGNLRVPPAIIDTMRTSPCVALTLSQTERIALLLEDYAHFVATPEILNQQLDCLTSLHSKEKIQSWKDLSNQGKMKELVQILLEHHYDPTYLRAIDRNFSQMKSAQSIFQEGITEEAFATTAKKILGIS
jgi:tRNA 2-selenouridine synthase